MPNIGPLEIIIVLVIVLVIFGPKRLPELGKGLGRGMRDFKDAVTGNNDDDRDRRLEADSAKAAPVEAPPAAEAPQPAATDPARSDAESAPASRASSGENRP